MLCGTELSGTQQPWFCIGLYHTNWDLRQATETTCVSDSSGFVLEEEVMITTLTHRALQRDDTHGTLDTKHLALSVLVKWWFLFLLVLGQAERQEGRTAGDGKYWKEKKT